MLICAPAAAQTRIEVDLELALMVDVSRSMTERELEIQRRGYAAALRSDQVFAALQSGMLRQIAMTYIEWAGTQEVVIEWQLIRSREDLIAFADVLSARFNPALRRTSISSAIDYAAWQIEQNGFQGLRRVIDISGDGPNNQGLPVTEARDAALAQGITINGLPLMTKEGMGSDWNLDRLDIYYKTCVIGGPGAFVIPVVQWDQFADAVKRKLVLEIAAAPTPPSPIPVQYRDPSDCLIGEKIWQERRMIWGEP